MVEAVGLSYSRGLVIVGMFVGANATSRCDLSWMHTYSVRAAIVLPDELSVGSRPLQAGEFGSTPDRNWQDGC